MAFGAMGYAGEAGQDGGGQRNVRGPSKNSSISNLMKSGLDPTRSAQEAADPSRFAKTAAPLRREASVCSVLPASLCLCPFPS